MWNQIRVEDWIISSYFCNLRGMVEVENIGVPEQHIGVEGLGQFAFLEV